MKVKEINSCRICGNTSLIPILSLGKQSLTGRFPKSVDEKITSGPLELVKCQEQPDSGYCGLVQLKHSYDLDEMYGMSYGYRSSLNQSMVKHLHNKIEKVTRQVSLNKGDLVLDIGSNDSTLLQAYSEKNLVLVGVDPTGAKFKHFYPAHIQLIPEYFSANEIKKHYGNQKAKVVTSIAMFYDLESPLDFMNQVYNVLADDGIWVFEQSYMPTMLERNAYDTICHEHLEYYALKQIKWMADKVGFKIIDVEFNEVNGGSFCVIVAKAGSSHSENTSLIKKILDQENHQELNTIKPYAAFKERVFQHKDELIKFVRGATGEGKKILGYGASTKGNVILQFCNFSTKDISCIAEVNEDKFGCYTPGTLIPIVSEEKARAMNPDYFMVLPWHFREGIVEREKDFLDNGGKLLMPLPDIEVIEHS